MTTARDTFAREVAAGWGTADTGLPWALSGGTAAERTVTGGRGRLTLATSPGNVRTNRIDRPWADAEILAQVAPGQTAVGEALLIGLVLRRSAVTDAYYRARAHLLTDGTISLSVTRGVTTIGAIVPTGLTYTPGARLWMRARVDGHQVRARIWPAGTTEPAVWGVDRTITTDPVPLGDLGIAWSGFTTNTNTSPHLDVYQVDLTYRLAVEHRLQGEVGLNTTNSRLAENALAGTVTITPTSSARAVYTDEQTVHDLATVRVASGHHRAETPRLRVNLPAAGPWSARWYAWMPRLQDAGLGTAEVRSLAVLPTHAWVVHATAAGNIGTRLQLPDLAATPLTWTTEEGTAVATGQWWRCELAWDGTSTLTSRVFAAHALGGDRRHTWTGLTDPGRVLDLTGYRWRRRTTLYWGDQGTEVRALQLELLDLGYSLGPAGADGDFGNATLSAIQAFQTSRGITPVDGVPGPETRAAIDLALGRTPPPLYLSHVAVGTGPWIGPAEPVLAADTTPTRRLHVGYLPI